MKAWMSFNFGIISPLTTEIAALEHLKKKQVAQRATIAHLTISHQNILNSSLVKDFLNWSRAANSAVHGWIQPNFKLI